jgi:hypothetical protein
MLGLFPVTALVAQLHSSPASISNPFLPSCLVSMIGIYPALAFMF